MCNGMCLLAGWGRVGVPCCGDAVVTTCCTLCWQACSDMRYTEAAQRRSQRPPAAAAAMLATADTTAAAGRPQQTPTRPTDQGLPVGGTAVNVHDTVRSVWGNDIQLARCLGCSLFLLCHYSLTQSGVTLPVTTDVVMTLLSTRPLISSPLLTILQWLLRFYVTAGERTMHDTQGVRVEKTT
jgi:hypothetical protein